MTPERWQQVRQVFNQVLSLEAAERSSYLDKACASDPELRREVGSLLLAEDQAGSRFLNTPVVQVASEPPGAERLPSRVGRRVGAYTILEEIGHGGMGEVYRAVRADGEFNQEVAIKLVRGGHDSSSVLDRFRNERQILAGLDHPNIARLFDGGTTEEGVPYLVMELVDGDTIDSYCDAHKLNVTHRLELFRRVCAAVEYAHQRLVIHRDLKPGNILVTKDGVPKLLDFGIAKIFDPSIGTETTVARPMTPEYASPEQIRGESITTATDVYSLGVVLYQLLTGRSPYRVQTRTPHELSQAITQAEPDRPSAAVLRPARSPGEGESPQPTPEQVSASREGSPAKLLRRLSGDIDNIVLKALRKEPQRRYVSVEQFGEDICRHLTGMPVSARKDLWSYRAGKFVQRHKAGVAVVALILIMLLAGAVAIVREARIAETNRRRAEARFNDVRKLANSLIFEIHDSIADLPGATQARKLILQRSLEYLDSLAKESGSDPALMRELATAYGRIGALQGNPQDPNLGDIKGALASFQKSLQIRESLARLNPHMSKDRVELAVAYLDYSDFQRAAAGNITAGFEYCQKAIAILDLEAAATPKDLRVMAQSTRAYTNLGMMQVGEGAMGSVGTVSGGVADLQKALVLVQRTLEISPSYVQGQGQVGVINGVMGGAMLKLGDRSQALVYYRRALDVFQTLSSKGNNIRAAANTAVVMSKIADISFMEGRNSEAITAYIQTEQMTEKLVAADPHNEVLQRGLIADSVGLGHALVESGKVEEGLRYIQKARALVEADPAKTPLTHTIEGVVETAFGEALERQGKIGEAVQHYAKGKEILGAVRAGSPTDLRMKVYYLLATDHHGAALLKLGKTEDAQKEFDQSLALIEPLFRANSDNQEVRYALAQTYTRQGSVAVKLAEQTRAPAEKLAHWQAAREWLQKSLNIWSKVSNPARMSTSGLEVMLPGEVSRRLAECDAQIASLKKPGQSSLSAPSSAQHLTSGLPAPPTVTF